MRDSEDILVHIRVS